MSALQDVASNGIRPEWLMNAWHWLQAHVPPLANIELMTVVSQAGQKLVVRWPRRRVRSSAAWRW